MTIPDKPVDGPSLVWAADAVISAGGTMNCEAAVLGVPTWTTFAGELGAVDRELVEQGRMRVLSDADEVKIAKRQRTRPDFEAVADAVTEEILRTRPPRCATCLWRSLLHLRRDAHRQAIAAQFQLA